jgi:hypothetical protein
MLFSFLRYWISSRRTHRKPQAFGVPLKANPIDQDTQALQPALKRAHDLVTTGKASGAEAAYRDLLTRFPEEAQIHRELATAIAFQGRASEAISVLRQALTTLCANDALTHYNLGILLQQQSQWDEARSHYERACDLAPDLFPARHNLALLCLLTGDYSAGWHHHEYRLYAPPPLPYWLTDVVPLHHDLGAERQWKGEPVARLLLWSEQGLGDNLMMMRYLPIIGQSGQPRRAQALTVYCEKPLIRLMQSIPGVDRVIEKPQSVRLDSFDRHCSLMSLPAILGTRLDTIPPAPYLHIEPPSRERWRERLKNTKGRKVGFTWAGRQKTPRLARLSIAIPDLAPLFSLPDITWVSLRKNEHGSTGAPNSLPLLDWMDECTDLADTAALMMELDLVISIDTAVAHLAGALGRPLWLLLPHTPEWRWLIGREDSPWYASARIFRQQTPGDWGGVIDRVCAALGADSQVDPGDLHKQG